MKVGRFGLGFKSVFHLTGRRITINACGKTGDWEHPPFARGLQGLCYEDIVVLGQFFAESMTKCLNPYKKMLLSRCEEDIKQNKGNQGILTIIFSFNNFCSHSIKTRLAQLFQVSIHMHPSLQSSVGVRKKFYTSLFQWTSEVLVVLVQSSGLIVIACQVKSN